MRRDLTLPTAVLLLAATGLTAQQATFRSKTDLVVIDAVVVDSTGATVRGLTASDFALTDRGRVQPIATFEEVAHDRTDGAAAAPALPPALRRDVASNTAVQADRLIVVFIDDLHIWQGRSDKAMALARDLVTKVGDQASMAILFSSREGNTEVTQDRSVLLTAISGMKARQRFRRPHQGFLKQGAAIVDPAAPVEFRIAAVNAAQRASLQDFNDNEQYFESLKNAADMLAGEDQRRKAFVLISEGLDYNLSGLSGGGSTLAEIVGQEPSASARTGANSVLAALNALRRANAALYAIDPRGKVRPENMMLESWPPADCDVCENPPALPQPEARIRSREDSQFAWDNPVRVAQAGLGFLSEAAGGFAITDTDDLAGGLGRVLESLDHYYILGFYPVDTSGPSTHPVGLTVPGRPDYTVRFRRGYTPAGPASATRKAESLVDLARGVMPRSELPLRLTATPLPGAGRTASVAVALEVTAPAGELKESDSRLRDDISYSVLIVDSSKAKVTQRTGRSARFSMTAAGPSASEPTSVTYQVPLLIDLAPGRYQLRASAISRKLGKGGSVYLDVTVPDFSQAPLAVSAIALGFADGARVPVGRQSRPDLTAGGAPGTALPPAQLRAMIGENPLPFEPTLNRVFTASDAIRAYFEVVRSDVRSPVDVTIRVVDAGNETRMNFDMIIGPTDHGRVDLLIPLKTLVPGAFTLQVTAATPRHLARTETGFVLRPLQ